MTEPDYKQLFFKAHPNAKKRYYLLLLFNKSIKFIALFIALAFFILRAVVLIPYVISSLLIDFCDIVTDNIKETRRMISRWGGRNILPESRKWILEEREEWIRKFHAGELEEDEIVDMEMRG